MNKTDRLLAILLELQQRKVMRAEDLASLFETSVRTIYRDIQALSEAGVPVIGAPGQGYSLMEGYFLPPIMFTAEEAVALLIGTDFVEQRFDADYGEKARASRKKIESILPDRVRADAARVRKTMRLLAPGSKAALGEERDYLELVRRAILEERKLEFHYVKNMPDSKGNRKSFRSAAPYGLAFLQGSWTLIAWCDLRQGIRHFRLSRMKDLTILEERFEMPPDFHLENYRPPDDRNLLVRILAIHGIADRVKEAGNYYIETLEECEEGLLVSFRVRRPEEILHWVLGWGSDVVVLEPQSFRDRIRDEAEKMFKRY
ncbi:helix-turn-helix transcriptional regulator [Paenibacillus sp. Y412MC10]|uniref:helix-turn-helix transcriptional regulator n=1 Tax=Geobacillus sp. (strain Y412MC10) TaxID=481743 RepID=UPI000178921E|nr:YafY family protein [Paenibacillus sp. Y412MC10]ACX68408.1 Helix-turn-helix type 11 domain protein [Paenibacillus sp. Y412MC10]